MGRKTCCGYKPGTGTKYCTQIRLDECDSIHVLKQANKLHPKHVLYIVNTSLHGRCRTAGQLIARVFESAARTFGARIVGGASSMAPCAIGLVSRNSRSFFVTLRTPLTTSFVACGNSTKSSKKGQAPPPSPPFLRPHITCRPSGHTQFISRSFHNTSYLSMRTSRKKKELVVHILNSASSTRHCPHDDSQDGIIDKPSRHRMTMYIRSCYRSGLCTQFNTTSSLIPVRDCKHRCKP